MKTPHISLLVGLKHYVPIEHNRKSYIWLSKWQPSFWPFVTLEVQNEGHEYENSPYIFIGWSKALGYYW